MKSLYKKERANYLHSPVALIFLGTFLVLTLFSFFVADKFFERNIADLRPLFHWLPVLLIFLVAALTMRSWAEERAQGTLELLMTWPVKTAHLVLGKFFGVLALVGIALALTFPLPLTVEILGDLDWGPVFGGYLASLLVAGAYTAIGLWISSLSSSQIVSLFVTSLVCGLFYLLGSDLLVSLAPNAAGEILRALGTGSRFESVARGVVDVRDLVYYLSLTVVFLTLNVYGLTRQRFSSSENGKAKRHHRQAIMTVALVILNLTALNLWLAPITALRLDLTARHDYSISPATKSLLRDLKEPLTIKFYSSDTHPLLKPLVPRLRDLIKEYEIVSKGKVRGVFVDPTQDAAEEKEANQTYNIKPVPFQVPGRHELKIVNSYFNVLVLYGDQHVVLNFEDLIELSLSNMNDLEVRLRNPEYDLTKSIKKVVYGFQGPEELFAAIDAPLQAQVIYTTKTLPQELKDVPQRMAKVYEELAKRSNGKFTFELVDLDAAGAKLTREQVQNDLKIKPFAVSPFLPQTFYLHTVLKSGKTSEVLYPTGELSENDIRAAIESTLKRRAKGFMKVVGLWTPPRMPQMMAQFGGQQPEARYDLVQQKLESEYSVKPVDLKSGAVARDVDLLLLIKPRAMDDVERFAVDQFLMQGGTVIVASGAHEMVPSPTGGLGMQPLVGGLDELLASYGVKIEKNLVMDLQNEPFPVPVMRDVGGFQVQEIQLLRYPFFLDIRQDGMAKNHPALSGLPQFTLQWSSSLTLNDEKLKSGQAKALVHSSAKSWTQTSADIQPNFDLYPETGFPSAKEFKSQTVVASVQGPLQSYYHDKVSPLTRKKSEKAAQPSEYDQIVAQSPESARLVVVGSGDFLSDMVLGISRNSGREGYQNNLQFLLNMVDWSLEDADLLPIRSRGSYSRILLPVNEQVKLILELTNYGLVLVSLSGLAIFIRVKRRRVKPLPLVYRADQRSSTPVQEEAA